MDIWDFFFHIVHPKSYSLRLAKNHVLFKTTSFHVIYTCVSLEVVDDFRRDELQKWLVCEQQYIHRLKKNKRTNLVYFIIIFYMIFSFTYRILLKTYLCTSEIK